MHVGGKYGQDLASIFVGRKELGRSRGGARALLASEIAKYPDLYFLVRALSGRVNANVICRSTQLVIEGYPRSANSATVHGFLDRQSRPVRVAHHVHHVAQLLRAIQWGIPAVALIRSPGDAIVSHAALSVEVLLKQGGFKRGSGWSFDVYARAWANFYAPLVGREGDVLIAHFDHVIRDLPALIHAINEKFGTSFETGIKRDSLLGYHAVPGGLRGELKRDIGALFAEQLASSPRLRNAYRKCSEIYMNFKRV